LYQWKIDLGSSSQLLAFNLNGLGEACLNLGKTDDAIINFLSSIEYFQSIEDGKEDDELNLLAFGSCKRLACIFLQQKMYDEGLHYHKKAFEMMDRIQPIEPTRIATIVEYCKEIADIYEQHGDYTKAIQCLNDGKNKVDFLTDEHHLVNGGLFVVVLMGFIDELEEKKAKHL